jgi:hypothetical protein
MRQAQFYGKLPQTRRFEAGTGAPIQQRISERLAIRFSQSFLQNQLIEL